MKTKIINPFIRVTVAVKEKDVVKLKWYQECHIHYQIRIDILGMTTIFLN